jgi:hypothetical protein
VTPPPATENFFTGVLDDLEMFVLGTSTDTQFDYGTLNLAEDNAFVASELNGFDAADVNLDGTVSGDGTGPAGADDVTAFVQGWKSRNFVNGIRVGDLNTRLNGDLDFDGVVKLDDAFILHEGLIASGAGGLDFGLLSGRASPEPATWLLLAVALAGVAAYRRRPPFAV